MIQTYEQWLGNYIARTKNQPTRHVSMDDLTAIARNGHDSEGNKMIDKHFDLAFATVTVALPDGQWRTYRN